MITSPQFFKLLSSSCCLLLSTVISQADVTAKAQNIDKFIYPAEEIILDSSYETMDEKGNSSKGAGVPKKFRDYVSVAGDPAQAVHGNNYMSVKGCKERVQLYIRIRPKQNYRPGKYTASTWLKGNGIFRFQILLYSKKSYLKSIMSKDLKVTANKWQKFSFEFDAPESVDVKGKNFKVMRIAPAFLITGDIDFDQSSMMPTASLRKLAGELNAMDSPLAKSKLPLLFCVKTEKAPRMDGTLDGKEWKNVPNTTGFVELDTQKMSPKQPFVSACYDAKNIYFGTNSIRIKPFNAGKDKKGKLIFTQHVDAQEIWLKSPQSKLFHFYGTPAGGILVPRKPMLQYSSQYRDSGETVGGVLTFGKTIWTTETAIPFKNFNATPKNGDIWKVNFNADYAAGNDEARRKSADWTTWSPVKTFNDYKGFGNLVFSEKIPAFRYDSVGDLNNGQIRVSATINSPIKARLRVVALVEDKNQHPVRFSGTQVINVDAGRSQKFEIKGRLSVTTPSDFQLTVLAFNTQTGDLYSALKIPFNCKPSFKMSIAPIHGKKLLYVILNAKDITIPAAEVTAAFTMRKKGGNTVFKKNLQLPRQKLSEMQQFSIADIKPGEYEVWCEVKKNAASKDFYAATMAELVVPDLQKVPWWNNKIGITEEIPPPWTPVKAVNNRVMVTERAYTLANSGLPEKINVLGKEIFTRPPQIVCKVNGRAVKPVWLPLKLQSRKPGVVTYSISGSAGPVKLSGSVAIEYDGFAMWKFKVHKNPAATLDNLALEFPFKLKNSYYARGNALIKDEIYCAFLGNKFKQETPDKPKFVNCHSSVYGWQWPETMMHQLWTGGDKSGFSLMIDSDEFFRGKKRYTYVNTPDARIKQLHLVSKPVKLNEDLNYDIAYQATPMKPRPKNPKIWHTTIEGKDGTMAGFKKRVFVTEGLTYWDLKPLCYPKTFFPLKSVQRRMKSLREYGLKLVPYFCFSYAGTQIPFFKAFEAEWRNHPGEVWNTPRGPALFCNPKSSFKDYTIWAAAMVHDKLGYDGVYLDVSRPYGSTSPFQNAGYVKDGKRIPTANIFAMREVFKRVYTHYHTGGRNGVLFLHGLNYPGTDSFTDVNTEGESWYAEQARGYSRITPEFFRARDMKIQFGNPFVFFASYYYDWKSARIGYVSPLREVLAITLPHQVLPAIGREEIWPFWDYIDQWWTDSDFLPYWDNDGAIICNDKKILVSAYIKHDKKKAILTPANWDFTTKDAVFTITPQKLFGKNGKLINAGGKLKISGNTLTVPLAKRDFAFIEIIPDKTGNYQIKRVEIKKP